MASLVCDRTPCDYMQAALESLVSSTCQGNEFTIQVITQIDERISFLVPLRYCPFCGTRVDQQWVRGYYGLDNNRRATG